MEDQAAGPAEAGHRSVPHTADIRIEAWAPTRELCIAEAVAGMVETFVDMSTATETDAHSFEAAEDTDEDLLVAVLGEVLYLMDTADRIPVTTDVTVVPDGLDVRFGVVDLRDLELVGAVPKAVSLHELRFEGSATAGWTGAVTLDV